KTYSEGPSGAEGGQLGAFQKKDMVKPFADKAFAMQAGEISEPVRTQFGWHIIKMEKINPASQLSYPQALPKILDKLTAQRAKNRAYDEAEQIYELTFEGDDLSLVAPERKLDIQTTDFFTRQGPAKGVKDRVPFASAAFSLQEGDISDVQNLGDGYYIIQLIEKIEAQIPELETVKAAVQTAVVAQKQDEQAQAEAKSFAANLNAAGALAEESRKIGLEPMSTGFFKRNASIPDIGYETQLLKAAFELNPTNKFSAEGIKGVKGYYVLGFKARQEPDLKSFEGDKAKIKKSLLEQKKYKTFSTWLTMLKDRSEIQIVEDFLN
ncbi:MAG: peptidyl-prolyl cis-trans isomerase, partial [Desulfobacterales bacterium]